MQNESVLSEFRGESGECLKVGERYISDRGIEMEVARISRLAEDREVWVEFQPVDRQLADRLWWGVFLPAGRNATQQVNNRL
jgi:hypothetical protein